MCKVAELSLKYFNCKSTISAPECSANSTSNNTQYTRNCCETIEFPPKMASSQFEIEYLFVHVAHTNLHTGLN